MLQSIYEDEFPELFAFIHEEEVKVYYNPSQRSFSVGGIDTPAIQEIAFCPWSGKKLPKSLAKEFAAKLESLGLGLGDLGKWPEEWRSEAWWMKEGL